MRPLPEIMIEPPKESALASAKALLESSKDKTWQQLVNEYNRRELTEQEEEEPAPTGIYCERLSDEELDMSTYRVNRSRSVDLSFISREKYLSRFSRENTPIDSQEKYYRHVRRSYTPVREIAAVEKVEDNRRDVPLRARTPLAMVTAPYHTNITYRSEQEPFRKYDVFQLRTWSYPIYKYIYGRDQDYRRPYSYGRRDIGTTTAYTPPQMAPESRPLTSRRGYSGYSYLASETNYDIASRPSSLKDYMYRKTYVGTTPAPWYWSYGRSSGLRHFNSYRPSTFTSSQPYWKPYY